MGMNAYVLCVGTFNEDIVASLDYVKEFYEDTKPGAVVTSHILRCATSDQSRQLAEVLGCEAWDFNTHNIAKTNVNWDELYDLAKNSLDWFEAEHVDSLKALLNAGFLCVYMPNG